MKTKTITLEWIKPSFANKGVYQYKVATITDSVEYHPGQILEKAEVLSLCKAKDWKVKVSLGVH